MMTGYDIRNAMNRAYGISSKREWDDVERLEVNDGWTRLGRVFMALAFAMRGAM
jgi:hypothetical protein